MGWWTAAWLPAQQEDGTRRNVFLDNADKLVSHTMDDVLAVADRVVVLSHGRIVADRPTAGLDADALKHLIIGGARAA